MSKHSMFIVLYGGEPIAWTTTREDALFHAKEHFDQHVTDFLRHKLPLKLSQDEIDRVDVHVFELRDGAKKVVPPFQDWIDEYYDARRKYEREDNEREYKQYLKLREKYGDTLPAEAG